MSISKGERAELRSVVKQQFKVLRSEVEQRKAELQAEIEQQITERFRAEDETRETVVFMAAEIAREANRKLNDVVIEHGLKVRDGYDREWFSSPRMSFSDEERHRMRLGLNADVEATVRGAKARLDRQEADLLRSLAVDAVESEEARSFLAAIPTVGELVPSSRLRAIDVGDEKDAS